MLYWIGYQVRGDKVINFSFKHLKGVVEKFRQAKILVIGDVMLDEFIWGKVSRISPESPVPVVDVHSESVMLGGAANVAANLQNLGAKAYLAGVIGKDRAGETVKKELRKRKVSEEGLILDGKRKTTLKSRLIAHSQQVARMDRENREEIKGTSFNQLTGYVKSLIPKIDAVIISDYGKGVVSRKLLQELLPLLRAARKYITVDPKLGNFFNYRQVTLITPNQQEVERALGVEIRNELNLFSAGKEILKRLNCESLLVTRGEGGMTLFEPNRKPVNIPTVAREVYDVTGAGDTVISTLTLALVVGISKKEAAHLANLAAGIVVGEVGTVTLNPKELLEAIESEESSE